MVGVVEIPVTGSVTVNVRVNIRQGAPTRSAALLRKETPGTSLDVIGVTAGEAVQGNSLWYRLVDRSYVWSGACSRFEQGESRAAIAAPAPVPSTTVTMAVETSEFPHAMVVDLYHGDIVRSFDEARVGGVLGIIHKATTGATGRDDLYHVRRRAALDAGMLWGAYHWGTARPIEEQIDNFLSYAEPDENTLLVLDFEDTPGNQMTLSMARQFLEVIAHRTGGTPVIYSGHTLKGALGATKDPFFASQRLWLAQYGPVPKPQPSWTSPWLWQFTEGKAGDPRKRKIPGIPGNTRGELDCNHFFGTQDQLRSQWAGRP